MNSFLITSESPENSLGEARQALAVTDCIKQSVSTQPVVHVRKDGTRLVSNGPSSWFAVTRNGRIFDPEDYTTLEEDLFLENYASAIEAFLLAA